MRLDGYHSQLLVHDLIFKYELYGVEHEEQLFAMSDEFLRAEIDGHKAELARQAALDPFATAFGKGRKNKKKAPTKKPTRSNKKISCKSKSK